jgi:hypothetical protein
MSRTVGRTDYCRAQAAECAAAAETTTILELKEAYLNLEQGWLQLAPEIEGGRISSISREPDKSDQKSGQSIRRNAPRT